MTIVCQDVKQKPSRMGDTIGETQKATGSIGRTNTNNRSPRLPATRARNRMMHLKCVNKQRLLSPLSPMPKKLTYLIHHQGFFRELNEHIMLNTMAWYHVAERLKTEEAERMAFLERLHIVMSLKLLPDIIEGFKERWGSKHISEIEEHGGDYGFYVTHNYEVLAAVCRIPEGAPETCRNFNKTLKKAQINSFLQTIDKKMDALNTETLVLLKEHI